MSTEAARRSNDASLGKMLATRVRRLISRLSRSRVLLVNKQLRVMINTIVNRQTRLPNSRHVLRGHGSLRWPPNRWWSDSFRQFRHSHVKSPGDKLDVAECYVSIATLDAAYVCPVQTATVRERFLGKPLGLPRRTHANAEFLQDIRLLGHAQRLAGSCTLGPRTISHLPVYRHGVGAGSTSQLFFSAADSEK
jgi:hypothetical protein